MKYSLYVMDCITIGIVTFGHYCGQSYLFQTLFTLKIRLQFHLIVPKIDIKCKYHNARRNVNIIPTLSCLFVPLTDKATKLYVTKFCIGENKNDFHSFFCAWSKRSSTFMET